MQSKEQNNLIIARFFPGEDVYEQLKAVCKKYNVKTAVLLSGIGQLGEFELGFFKEKGDYVPQKFSQSAELLSLTGTVVLQDDNFEFHLHSVLGFQDKSVVGGHFIAGKVSITLEVVLLKTNLEMKRQIEDSTGLKGMFLE
jgi:uncharacterized protein